MANSEALAIQRVEAMLVLGPQKLNKGNLPKRLLSFSRQSVGTVKQSGNLRPSAL